MLIPKKTVSEYDIFRKRKLSYRLIRKSDAERLRAPVLVVVTKGRGKQRRFAGFFEDYADIASVGKTYADLYLLMERRPMRIRHSEGRILVKDED